LIHRDGIDYCIDIFEPFVTADQTVALGDSVVRRYATANRNQSSTIIHVYCSESASARYVTDEGVRRCGTLRLDLVDPPPSGDEKPLGSRREIQARMTFGGTEIKVAAIDVTTGCCVKSNIDFLNNWTIIMISRIMWFSKKTWFEFFVQCAALDSSLFLRNWIHHRCTNVRENMTRFQNFAFVLVLEYFEFESASYIVFFRSRLLKAFVTFLREILNFYRQ